ncbi:hypothetical protein [Terriglobus saanensis]|uniref:DUF4136 domain-containing protein n=1 Tax=Terriglobus saanensis (strain ATCC BAA-1853 / DSM 23119 / SP1PR4) TaxID=401053 RepID=E8UXL7_TERSS|nr:hypothetical protein [Terriglobus saanensis]ADV81961.1 hypothetical protein AciPR4_1133 [Terriglobus saanensis SP1PR4]
MRYPLNSKLALASTLSVLLFAATAGAQTPEPPAAPLPAALTSATKLFIGNAGDQENADCLRAYNSFYQGIGALSRFQLVADPNAADLVLELHYEISPGQSIASGQGSGGFRQFRVVLQDPHSHIVLWSLTERTNYAVRQKNRDKNLDETIAALVKDFDSLVSPQPVPPKNKSIIRH